MMEAIVDTRDKTFRLLSGHLGESDVVVINEALDKAYNAGRESMLKEVVDAVWNESYGDPRIAGYIHIKWTDWQTKLKEWGIEQNEGERECLSR